MKKETWKDKLMFWWFVISTLAAAVFAFLWHRRKTQVKDMAYQMQKNKLNQKIEKARQNYHAKEIKSVKDYSDYATLLKRYNGIAEKLGIALKEPKSEGESS